MSTAHGKLYNTEVYGKWFLADYPYIWPVVLWQNKGNYLCSCYSIQVDSTDTNNSIQHEWLSSYLSCHVQKCPIFKKWIVQNVLLPQMWASIIHLTWDNTGTNTNNLIQVPAYIYIYPANQKLLTNVSSWHLSMYYTVPSTCSLYSNLIQVHLQIMNFNSISTHYSRISKKNSRSTADL